MQYVEVFYLNKMQVVTRKSQEYDEKEIETTYRRTIGKLTQEKKSALVCHRNEAHELIKSELLKWN